MRNAFYILMLSLALTVSGCVSSTVKESVQRNATRTDTYVKKMDSGQTTHEEDKRFIYAIRVYMQSLNWNINDVEPDPDVKLILERLGLNREGE